MNNIVPFAVIACCIFFPLNLLAEEYSTRVLVTATEEATISSELSSKVESIPFEEGTNFKKSDILIKLDCSFFEAQKDVVQAELESAIVTLKSNQELATMRSIGEYEVQLSQIAVDRAKSELKIAQLNTDRCIIRAPYDGTMSKVFVNEYESIERQQPMIQIIGSGILEAKLMISSKWLSWLSEGHPLTILIDENGLKYSATVNTLGANIDPVSQTIDATDKFDENYETLLPGMSGTATF